MLLVEKLQATIYGSLIGVNSSGAGKSNFDFRTWFEIFSLWS